MVGMLMEVVQLVLCMEEVDDDCSLVRKIEMVVVVELAVYV